MNDFHNHIGSHCSNTFFTIISGVNKLESIKKLQSIGGKIMLIYIGTSLLSVFIGSLIALTINPGKGEEGLLICDSPFETHLQESVYKIL